MIYYERIIMTIRTIDYASSYLKCKISTLIQGEPKDKSHKRLKLELQTNASSVEIDFGGGHRGCIFINS